MLLRLIRIILIVNLLFLLLISHSFAQMAIAVDEKEDKIIIDTSSLNGIWLGENLYLLKGAAVGMNLANDNVELGYTKLSLKHEKECNDHSNKCFSFIWTSGKGNHLTSFNKEEAENIFGKDVVEKILTDQNIKEISYNIYCNKKPKEKQINLIKSTKLESNDLIFKRKDGSNIDVNINKTLCYTSNFGIDYSCFSIDNFINTYYTDDIKQKEDERTIYNKNNEEMMEKYKQFQEQYKKKGKKSKKSE